MNFYLWKCWRDLDENFFKILIKFYFKFVKKLWKIRENLSKFKGNIDEISKHER